MSAEVETLPLSNGTLISPFAQKVQRAPIPDGCDEVPHKPVLLNGHAGSHADPPSGPPSVRTSSPPGSEPRQSGSTPSSAHQQSVGTAGSGPQQSGSTPGSGASQQQQQQQSRYRTGFRDLFHSNAADAADSETTASTSYTASGGIAAALLSAMRRTTGQNGSQDGSAVKVFPNGDRYIGQWRDGQVCCCCAPLPPGIVRSHSVSWRGILALLDCVLARWHRSHALTRSESLFCN